MSRDKKWLIALGGLGLLAYFLLAGRKEEAKPPEEVVKPPAEVVKPPEGVAWCGPPSVVEEEVKPPAEVVKPPEEVKPRVREVIRPPAVIETPPSPVYEPPKRVPLTEEEKKEIEEYVEKVDLPPEEKKELLENMIKVAEEQKYIKQVEQIKCKGIFLSVKLDKAPYRVKPGFPNLEVYFDGSLANWHAWSDSDSTVDEIAVSYVPVSPGKHQIMWRTTWPELTGVGDVYASIWKSWPSGEYTYPMYIMRGIPANQTVVIDIPELPW